MQAPHQNIIITTRWEDNLVPQPAEILWDSDLDNGFPNEFQRNHNDNDDDADDNNNDDCNDDDDDHHDVDTPVKTALPTAHYSRELCTSML